MHQIFSFIFLALFVILPSPCRSNEVAVITTEVKQAMVEKAAKARLNAYAPYSKFKVGAAVLTEEGKIISGCNVENASYGLACCAERVAIFKAVSKGHTKILAVAVVVPGGGTPCGACRQVLNEFNPDMPVFLGNEEGELVEEMTLTALLPYAFGPHNLEK